MNYPGPEAFVIDTQPGEAQGQTPGYVGPQEQCIIKEHI